jgi:hypothetical protein
VGAPKAFPVKMKPRKTGIMQLVAVRFQLCDHLNPGGFIKLNLKLTTCIATASCGDFLSFACVAYAWQFLPSFFSLMNP